MRTLLITTCLMAGAVHADIEVTFRDGAPKDRFTITNTSDCATDALDLTLDLATAPAGVIFDITSAGDGVEVFQPFEVVSGGGSIENVSTVTDGDQLLTLQLASLGPAAQIGFTIDLDDTGGGREIVVSGAEIAGATVRIATADFSAVGTFADTGRAIVPMSGCSS